MQRSWGALFLAVAACSAPPAPVGSPVAVAAAPVAPTPVQLSIAVWNEDRAAVEALIARGAALDRADENDMQGWTWALVNDDRAMVRDLLERTPEGPLVDKPAGLSLRVAAGFDERFLASELLRRGARPDEPMDGRATPLIVAAANGYVEMMDLLLDAGAGIDVQDTHGDTPLMAAVRDGSVEAIRFLLDRGADRTLRDHAGRTAADWARRSGRSELVQLFEPGAVAAPPARPARDLRKAIATSLALLQQGARRWDHIMECGACHMQPVMTRVLGAADRHGLAYDREQAAALDRWWRTTEPEFATLAREALKKPDGPLLASMQNGGDLAFAIAWFEEGLARGGPAAVKSSPDLLLLGARMQRPDGRWRPGVRRGTTESSVFKTTAQMLFLLDRAGGPAERAELAERKARGLRWIREHQPVTLDDLVFRMLGLRWGGAPDGEVRQAAAAVRERQAAGGGWAFLPGRTPDACETGLALWALLEAGDLEPTDPIYRRGVDYLLRTQEADGSWLVHSRAIPLNNYLNAGFPHRQFQYISFTGTAWATVALIEALPPP